MNLTPTELALQSRVDKREIARAKADEILNMDAPTDTDDQHLELLREEMVGLDAEISQLLKDKEMDDTARANSKIARQALLNHTGDMPDDGVIYRTMAEYARDFILTRETRECSKIASQFANESDMQAARARLELLKRTPANTLSSDVAGISVAQHIDQIFQIIDTSRPIVASATRADLNRGQLTYPSVDTKPIVSVQSTQKTEAGNQKMAVSLKTATASTYLGGGDLSWQAINWSTPNALDLWFRLAAADYALKTEQDAAAVIMHTGYAISSAWNAASGNFADLLSAVGRAAAGVWTNSGRTADTVYMSMDAYWYVFGLTSTAFAQFATVSGDRVGPFRFVASRGLDAATIVVGDSSALLVAETPGAPVELRVVEPAIGGVEVGIIGAFEAVIVDPGAFTRVSSAS